MSAEAYAQEYYALVREEILNTAEYSPEMKMARSINIQQVKKTQNVNRFGAIISP